MAWLNVSNWQKTADRSFSIGLKPVFGDENKVALKLHVSFPSTYPKTHPRLRLSFEEDVRPKSRKHMLDLIQNVPKRLEAGSEMVYEIATMIQEELDNSSKIIPEEVPTLDEERATREAALLKAQEEEQMRQIEASKASEVNGSEEEQRLLNELLEQERIRSAQRKANKVSSQTEQKDLYEHVNGIVKFDQSSMIKDRHGKLVEVKSVHDKTLYRKGTSATIYTVQVLPHALELSTGVQDDIAVDSPFLVLKEYVIASTGSDDKIRKAVQHLEANLDQQTHRLSSHPNIMKPINYLILRSDSHDETSVTSGWKVSVLTEMATRGSLLELLEIAGQVSDNRKLRGWALQILEGLHHYHRQGLAHASLHLGNVLLDQGEAKNIVARLSDGSYGHVLHALEEIPVMSVPVSWKAPKDTPDQTEVSHATDIWDFGICLLQMGFGINIVHDYTSPAAVLDDLMLSSSFRALLRQVFAPNARKRPSAWDVLHFEFFRNDDALLEHHYGVAGRRRPLSTSIPSMRMRHPRRESTAGTTSSRYAKEFVEDGRLGRGGFGEVFRARNRIDGQLYAIKKIKARSKAALDPVLSEASVLSRLNHPNVVRYFASWIDDAITTEDERETDTSAGGLSASLSHLARDPILPPSSRVRFPILLQCALKRHYQVKTLSKKSVDTVSFLGA